MKVVTCQAFNGAHAAPSSRVTGEPPENRCRAIAEKWAVAPGGRLPCAVVVAVCLHHGATLGRHGWRVSTIPKEQR